MNYQDRLRQTAEELAKTMADADSPDAWEKFSEGKKQMMVEIYLPAAEYVLQKQAEAWAEGFIKGVYFDRYNVHQMEAMQKANGYTQ